MSKMSEINQLLQIEQKIRNLQNESAEILQEILPPEGYRVTFLDTTEGSFLFYPLAGTGEHSLVITSNLQGAGYSENMPQEIIDYCKEEVRKFLGFSETSVETKKFDKKIPKENSWGGNPTNTEENRMKYLRITACPEAALDIPDLEAKIIEIPDELRSVIKHLLLFSYEPSQQELRVKSADLAGMVSLLAETIGTTNIILDVPSYILPLLAEDIHKKMLTGYFVMSFDSRDALIKNPMHN